MKGRMFRPLTWFLCAAMVLALLLGGVGGRFMPFIERPLSRAGTWIYQQSGFGKKFSDDQFMKLKEQLVSVAIDRAELEQFRKENIELKEALRFVERRDLSVVSASVVARSNALTDVFFRIDQGSERGIQKGDPVIVGEGILIGKVSDVLARSAVVRTLSDPSVSTALSLLHRIQTIGVAEGLSGNLIKLKFIPRDTQITQNDLVVTSGLETGIPTGLFVGLVNDVRPESHAPFLEAVIEPLVDIRDYSIVHVLTRKKE